MRLEKAADNVFWMLNGRRRLLSLNLAKGETVYGERLFTIAGKEYREWMPNRSKLAALLFKGFSGIDIRFGSKVLYLGASSGTTVSHVSDIIGPSGAVYAVEIAEEMGVNLVFLAERRPNIYPIIADASKTESYSDFVPKCDFIYQDIAQREQVKIFLKNAGMFVKQGGSGVIAIKSRSIDVSMPSERVISAA